MVFYKHRRWLWPTWSCSWFTHQLNHTRPFTSIPMEHLPVRHAGFCYSCSVTGAAGGSGIPAKQYTKVQTWRAAVWNMLSLWLHLSHSNNTVELRSRKALVRHLHSRAFSLYFTLPKPPWVTLVSAADWTVLWLQAVQCLLSSQKGIFWQLHDLPQNISLSYGSKETPKKYWQIAGDFFRRSVF